MAILDKQNTLNGLANRNIQRSQYEVQHIAVENKTFRTAWQTEIYF